MENFDIVNSSFLISSFDQRRCIFTLSRAIIHGSALVLIERDIIVSIGICRAVVVKDDFIFVNIVDIIFDLDCCFLKMIKVFFFYCRKPIKSSCMNFFCKTNDLL